MSEHAGQPNARAKEKEMSAITAAELEPTFEKAIAAVEAGAVAVVDVRVEPEYTAAMTAAMTRKSE